MVVPISADKIVARCNNLKRGWFTRNKKFKDWYNLLLLKDELEQEGMESVTSNDPRTGFNLALHLLTSSIIAHKIPSENLDPTEVTAVSYVERRFTRAWTAIEASYRRSGRQSWLRDFVSFMLATGWYSVFAMVDDNGFTAEVWHPADVFPQFGDDGLVECAHIYPLSAAAAHKKVRAMGWSIRSPFTGTVNLYNYWVFDADGDVTNAIVLGREYVKLPVKEMKLSRIPIFISPVSGLPDRGSLTGANKWQEHFGESILATNEGVTKNFNKVLTYQQQLVRDVANPRWFERSSGDTPILTEENLFKRGAIFRGALQDSVEPLAVPPIPVEMRTMLFEYGNMQQRGLFPSVLFGNIQQQLAGYAMSQVASAAMQVLTPYELGIKGLLTDIDNFFLTQIIDNNYTPNSFDMPANFPDDAEFAVDFNINIPGYLIQRATVARMLDPTFRLSTRTVMENLFPEIKDPLMEQAIGRKDEAMMHPKAIAISLITAWKEEARRLRDLGDTESAELFEMAAESAKAELVAPQAAPAPTDQAGAVTIPREVQPREVVEPNQGLTEGV